ncbi:MAG: glycosyltransferase [Alphaproteobacteria bacterium]|nr:glycosyltransferase [Alphaproteobacteria bacterium]
MKAQPLITVYIPYYNDAKFLRKSIDSVLGQSYKNFELILLNHATTDNCREIAHSYNDNRIKHIDMPRNEGGGGGMLFATMLNNASGKYIKPLCADDMMRPNCLETMVDFMESHPDIDFAFGDVEYIDENGRDLHDSWFKSRPGFDIKDDAADLIRKYSDGGSMLPYIGNISKRNIFTSIQIEKTFVMMFDMSLWLQLLCKGYNIGYINEKVCNYRIHSGQMSSIDKEAISGYMSWFEWASYFQYTMGINSIDLAKKVFPNSVYANNLSDVKDIPFFIAHEMYNKHKPLFDIPLVKMLNDDETRERLMKHFGFGVKELRELRKSDFHINWPITSKGLKQKIYCLQPQNINMFGLAFLMLRRLIKVITLDKFRHRHRKKYSL